MEVLPTTIQDAGADCVFAASGRLRANSDSHTDVAVWSDTPGGFQRGTSAALVLALTWLGKSAEAGLGFDGTNDEITGSTGTISLGDEHLTTTGNLTGNALTLTGLDCTGNSNGGALTTDGSGNVVCSDDDSGVGGGGSVILMHGNGAPTGLGDTNDRWALNGADNQVDPERATYPLTRSGTAQSLCVVARNATAATASVDVTVYHNGSPTALKVTLTGNDGFTSSKCNFVDSVAVTQSNGITIRMEGTPATPDVNPANQYFASFEII